MGRRNSRRDDGLVGLMVDLALEGIALAGELSPMKGVAVGVILAITLCGVIPGFLHLFSNSSSLPGMVIAKIADILGAFARFVGAVGALACIAVAGKNLIADWRYEANAGAQLVVVIAACLGFCLYLFSLLPSDYFQASPPGYPADTIRPAEAPAGPLTRALSQGVSQAIGSFPLPGVVRQAPISTLFSINANLVDIQYLDQQGFKVVREARCEPFVDMVLAAQRSAGNDTGTQTRAKLRINDAIKQGWAARCFMEKTPEERLPVGLRMYWQNNSQRLLQTGQCTKYSQWARDTVFANSTESERQYQLTRLFADAQAHGCMQ